jgi:hypothetical protein
VVVAHTNDFGAGAAGVIFNIRHNLSDRAFHLYALLIN